MLRFKVESAKVCKTKETLSAKAPEILKKLKEGDCHSPREREAVEEC